VNIILNFQRESGKILTYLYSLIIAFSLTTIITVLLTDGLYTIRSPLEIPIYMLLIFFSFLVTLIPFYHGAVIFLVKSYDSEQKNLKKGEFLFDFCILLIQSLVFFAMALSSSYVIGFIQWLIILLGIDIIWSFICYIKASDKKHAPPKYWGILNFITFIILILYLLFSVYEILGRTNSLVLLFIILSVRSITDYYFSYDYYFGIFEEHAPC